MRLLPLKKATDRFRRDTVGGCHFSQRLFLLHHTTQHRRPLGSGKSVCRLLWPWPPLLDHRKRRASLSSFLRSLAGVAPSDTGSLTEQGRGEKLVTEDWKPVGSGLTPLKSGATWLHASLSSSACVISLLSCLHEPAQEQLSW